MFVIIVLVYITFRSGPDPVLNRYLFWLANTKVSQLYILTIKEFAKIVFVLGLLKARLFVFILS